MKLHTNHSSLFDAAAGRAANGLYVVARCKVVDRAVPGNLAVDRVERDIDAAPFGECDNLQDGVRRGDR